MTTVKPACRCSAMRRSLFSRSSVGMASSESEAYIGSSEESTQFQLETRQYVFARQRVPQCKGLVLCAKAC